MSDEGETLWNARNQVKQRLEGLKRAGVTGIPLVRVAERPERVTEIPPATEPMPTLPRPSVAPRSTPPAPPVTPPPSVGPRIAEPVTPSPSPTSRPPERAPIMAGSRRSLFEEPRTPKELGPPVPPAERPAALDVLAQEIAACQRCPNLYTTRTHTVPGEGSPQARLVFMGEAPGADEDKTGRPFVGRGGQLLTDMITKGMGLQREEIFILNTIKCRPPENRVPLPDEQANCRGYLDRQLSIIRPEFLCLLGKTAAMAILQLDNTPATNMSVLRGRWFDYQGIRTIVTYHPAYLLRNPPAKKDAWEDLKLLMEAMGLEVPARN